MATDIPFWRRSTGAEQRIASVVRYLSSDGFEVRTFFLGQSGIDPDSPREQELISGSNFDIEHRASDQPPRELRKKLAWYVEATRHQLKQWAGRGSSGAGSPSGFEDSVSLKLADYRWPWAISAFREAVESFRPQSIMIQYIKLGYLLEALTCQQRQEIQCIVDTHDVLHLRAQQFRKRGFQHWIEVNRDEEAKSLAEFDTILAIQPEEVELFREMAPQCRTILCGHGFEPTVLNASGRASNVLTVGYLGSANAANAHAIQSFLEQIWQPLSATQTARRIRLVIAGGICDWLVQNSLVDLEPLNGVEVMGRVEGLEEFYNRVDVVINPVEFGTGLKIKNCEAIAFGKPLLTTSHGFVGMPKESSGACLVCDSPDEFSKALLEFANDFEGVKRFAAVATKLSQTGFSDRQAYSGLKSVILQGK